MSRKETSPAVAAEHFRRRWSGKRPPSIDDIIRSLERGFERVDEKEKRERGARLAWLRKHPMGDLVLD